MNYQQISIKHSALGWVKKAIDDNLSEVSTGLKLYIEEDDDALLGLTRDRLSMIQGVLTMIEQYGAAMLTGEMVSLCGYVIEHKLESDDQALEVLLRAVLQLPDYLEHIQSGYRDIPIAILPILNDIRRVKHEDLFSEKLLFQPDLSMHQGGAEVELIDDRQNQVSKLVVKKIIPAFQLALLNIIRDESVEESLQKLEKVCEIMEERSYSEQISRIWWIIGALIESLSSQQLEIGVSIKNLLGKVDALFRVQKIVGERGLLQRQPIDLIKNLLYYIAQPECHGAKIQAIKTAYRLEQFLPSETVRSKVLDNIAGPNQALLKTVAEAIRVDIESVKSTLEVYVNGDLDNYELLQDLPQEMHIISDTLTMIGLDQQRQLIESQIITVRNILEGSQEPGEEQLLSMAAELILVEQALDVMQKRQPLDAEDSGAEIDVSRDFEMDNVVTAVVTAALDDIQKTKSAILDFVKDSSRAENLDLCIALLEESQGALVMLNQPKAVAVVDGLLHYFSSYDIVEFMDSKRLDALSQTVVSLEYYLEALGEHRGDANNILDLANIQLQALISQSLTRPIESEMPRAPVGEVEADNLIAELAEIKIASTLESGEDSTAAVFDAESDDIEPTEIVMPGEIEVSQDRADIDTGDELEGLTNFTALSSEEAETTNISTEAEITDATEIIKAVDFKQAEAQPVVQIQDELEELDQLAGFSALSSREIEAADLSPETEITDATEIIKAADFEQVQNQLGVTATQQEPEQPEELAAEIPGETEAADLSPEQEFDEPTEIIEAADFEQVQDQPGITDTQQEPEQPEELAAEISGKTEAADLSPEQEFDEPTEIIEAADFEQVQDQPGITETQQEPEQPEELAAEISGKTEAADLSPEQEFDEATEIIEAADFEQVQDQPGITETQQEPEQPEELAAEISGKTEAAGLSPEQEFDEATEIIEAADFEQVQDQPGITDTQQEPEQPEDLAAEISGKTEAADLSPEQEFDEATEIIETADFEQVQDQPGITETQQEPEQPEELAAEISGKTEAADLSPEQEFDEATEIIEAADFEQVQDQPGVTDTQQEPEQPEELAAEISGKTEAADLSPEQEIDKATEIIDAVAYRQPQDRHSEDQLVSEINDDLEELHSVLDVTDNVVESEQDGHFLEDTRKITGAPPVIPGTKTGDVTRLKVEPVNEELVVLNSDSDPEILEIYLEEAEDEAGNIRRLQQDWLLHPEDDNAVKNIRRALHTIKGSGRLVGALKIGEFAWDYEQLLNRVIDKTVMPSDEVINAVGKAAMVLFELVNELKTSEPPTADIPYLRGVARALAAFKAEQVPIDHTMTLNSIESPYERITDDTEDDSGIGNVGEDTQAVSSSQTKAGLQDLSRSEQVTGKSEDIESMDIQAPVDSEQTQVSMSSGIDTDVETEQLQEVDSQVSDVRVGPGETQLIETNKTDLIFDPDQTTEESPQARDTSVVDYPTESDVEEIEILSPQDESPENEDIQSTVAVNDSDEKLIIETAPAQNVQESPPDPFVPTTMNQMPGAGVDAPTPAVPGPDESTSLSFDPELLTIYQQEVEQHLSTVNSALEHAQYIHELIPGEDIYRALHTIHGASRTADIKSIGELASLMEKPLKSAISQSLALDDEIVELYRQGYRELQRMTQHLVDTRQLPEISENLKISLIALAEDFEEHTVEIPDQENHPGGSFVDTLTMMNEPSDQHQDEELLTIFIDEANELLEMSDHTLHQWGIQQSDENGLLDYSGVMELQRYLHTLKGGARMAELNPISDLSHEMESMLIAVIDNRVEKNEDLVELLKNSFDILHRQVIEAREKRALSDPAEQIALLKSMRIYGSEDPVEELEDDLSDLDSESIDIVNEHFIDEAANHTERSSQEVIKVRSDLLDNLVNSAGEVSIYRARMEQQVAGIGSYLGELGQTISRVKSQLRNLEAETDAQIHFSHLTDAHATGEFDPLELDRYTLIQELSRSLSESVNDLNSLQGMLGDQVKDSETLLLQQSRVSTDLQDGLIKSRMVKFSGLLSRLRRLVRQSSQELAKKAELVISGENNEVDNKVLDRMVAPLEHIIRNALSHGIEKPVDRIKKGKPEVGVISIDISRDGSDIVIKVSDDGGGVNLGKVRSRALQLGLIEESQLVADNDLVQYILEPGFSTADHVTQLSGRGVGMDVVDIEIKQLGGTLHIETNASGSTFIARLPFTLSINQAILVRAAEEIYAIPLINIEGITRLENRQLVEYYEQDDPELEYAGQQFTLHYLSKLVESGSHFQADDKQVKQPIILTRSGDVRVALHVDEILGNREIVVKSLGKQLSQVRSLSGASILADGSVVLILDINGLLRHSNTSSVKIIYKDEDVPLAPVVREKEIVMVVDDSITMRRVASKLLERHNYKVVTAKDGVDALAQLEDVNPDVMLLDIEMPRMDGFELATHMRNEEMYSKIPIIMITSRTGEKHRDRAFEIGVTNYMGKPYQEDELIDNIQQALNAN